jgi:polyketide cyclase/dehydrase/lipid transport protein
LRGIPIDLAVRSEIMIDRPAAIVWPYVLDMSKWMSGLRFQNVAGTAGEEGEVRLVTAQADGTYPSYLITTVRVKPFEQYVLKVKPEEGSDYFGFADFSFTGRNGMTQLVYDIYLELRVVAADKDELRKIREQQCAGIRADVTRNNEALKRLVESSGTNPHGAQ